jgi:peptidoglycan hydrolase CwlO-like protein
MDVLEKFKELDELRDENEKLMMDVIELKNKRLTYQEARIDAMEREIERLKEELNAMYNQLNERDER